MSESWYVVQTRPCAEEKAFRHLANQGFEIYLPRYRRRVRHARKTMDVVRPLFPGYFFVRFDPRFCQWRSINGTIGVRKILTDGDLPAELPPGVLDEIRGREDEHGLIELSSPAFTRGQTVKLTEGPLADLNGIFEESRDDKRAVLLVSLLGRKVRMQVPTETLSAA